MQVRSFTNQRRVYWLADIRRKYKKARKFNILKPNIIDATLHAGVIFIVIHFNIFITFFVRFTYFKTSKA